MLSRAAQFKVPDRLFGRLVIAAVSIGFLIVLLVCALAAYVVRQSLAHTELVAHTHEVCTTLANYRVQQERLETARRGYLIGRDERFYATFRTASDALPPMIDVLERLTAKNPTQQARVATLRLLTDEQRQAGEASIRDARLGHLREEGDFNDDRNVVLIRRARGVATAMADGAAQLLSAREAARARNNQVLFVVMTAAGVLLVFVGIGSTGVIFRYTQDLARSRDALRKLNEGLEDAVKVRTADLQRANDEIQRFAYIVSHDLRSPLVNVMGFTAELEASVKPLDDLLRRAEAEAPAIVSTDARAAIQQDLPESIGFIRSSTQKMDRLINAILQLSRQGRRVLTPQRTDMQALMSSIADSLQHRTQDLGACVTVEPDLPDLVSDRLALEQIFSNLMENALKYLKPGRPGEIRIAGHREGSRLIYEIADNGRGIDPKDHERIFDLFRRSGTQDQPGEGIGLAHVRALAYRLGGTVSCESALDQGATFRVSLPAQLTGEGSHP